MCVSVCPLLNEMLRGLDDTLTQLDIIQVNFRGQCHRSKFMVTEGQVAGAPSSEDFLIKLYLAVKYSTRLSWRDTLV